MDKNVKAVLNELCKIENRDLLKAIIECGDEDDIQSFMFGFTYHEPASFDDFVMMENQVNFVLKPQLGVEPDDNINMSQRYDDYLKRMDTRNDQVALDKSASQRLENIVSKVEDTDPMGGWSGAYYGWLMRNVQFEASKLNSN